jgi:hypothetical protein
LTDFFGPQGPSSLETQGLLISTVCDAQEEIKAKNDSIMIIFFMFFAKKNLREICGIE